MKSQNLVLILFSIILLASCSTVKRNGIVQTRKYKMKTIQSVFHFKKSKVAKANPFNRNEEVVYSKTSVDDKVDTQLKAIVIQKEIDQGSQSDVIKSQVIGHSRLNEIVKEADDSCDLIVTTDAKEIQAQIVKVGVDAIDYKACDYIDGPTRAIAKSEVFYVKYRNGTKEVFNISSSSKPQPRVESYDNPSRDSNGGGAGKGIGVVLMIVGLITFLFVSIIIGGLIGLLGLILVISG